MPHNTFFCVQSANYPQHHLSPDAYESWPTVRRGHSVIIALSFRCWVSPLEYVVERSESRIAMGKEGLDQASESSIVPLVKASSNYQLILQTCGLNLDLLPQARACHVVRELAELHRDWASFKAIAPIGLLTTSLCNPSETARRPI